MKRLDILVVIFLAGCWAGCNKSDGSANESPAAKGGYVVPSGPQPKLQSMPLYIGAQTLDTELALTPEQEETGLMYRTNITDETAMLFVLPGPERASFWMTNCPISLSAAYIGPDGVIEEIHHLEKNDNVPVMATNDNIQYVLEVNDGWFIRHDIKAGTLIRTERGSLAQTFRR
ncbi:MAG TPA: DUF192 domain-containing protein [Verrucomicrobiae bacterium]|nr:DUF192 domain-containing protein [Verrucomicrobiae bacterium]